MAPKKVPYDPELATILTQLAAPAVVTRELIGPMREGISAASTAELLLAAVDSAVIHTERKIPGPHGDITLSIFSPKSGPAPSGGRPGVYTIHGGGMIVGNRFFGQGAVLEWVKNLGIVAVSVEYRLAPEFPDPVPIEECYTGLNWVGDHLHELGIDPARLMITGQSAGGGLAAGCALMVRDKGGPRLCAQLLTYPMLDDRNNSISCQQYPAEGTWSGGSNATAWECLLGERAGKETGVSIYAAPGRATDLSNLPPAFVEVSSAEPFRQENVAYAEKLWAHGIQCELHVWPGAFHGYDMMAPQAAISQISISTRTEWVKRTLGQVRPNL